MPARDNTVYLVPNDDSITDNPNPRRYYNFRKLMEFMNTERLRQDILSAELEMRENEMRNRGGNN